MKNRFESNPAEVGGESIPSGVDLQATRQTIATPYFVRRRPSGGLFLDIAGVPLL
jgi:hypothetical protein